MRRSDIIGAGGGGIAYPPESVPQQWPPEMQVWGNLIRNDGQALMDFSWDREWRIPVPGHTLLLKPHHIAAVLVGDRDWTPTPLRTDWCHGETGEALPGPSVAEAIPMHHYPPAWGQAPRLYWNGTYLELVQ
jgi:hypothetical protein